MKRPECRYIVKARYAYTNSQTKKIEFKAKEERFEKDNPILAREAAFGYRNLVLSTLLDDIGYNLDDLGWNLEEKSFKNLSERELRKLINPLLEPENESLETIIKIDDKEELIGEWYPPDDTISWYPLYNNGIWIIFEHDDKELIDEDSQDIVIDKITRYEEPLPTPPNFQNLELEYNFYKQHNLDTKSYETSELFFDDEAFVDGEDEKDDCYIRFNLLKTPFDWNGYDKIYWWEKNSNKSSTKEAIIKALPKTMQEAFAEGESEYAEFKPCLTNWPNSERNIEYENAIAICAFLNNKGGYLFVGVADKKKRIIGLDFSKISKDEFLRDFTRIKTRYLPTFIAHTINGDFYTSDGKVIFAVTVFPSDEPIFIRKKDEDNKLIAKEFYVRSDAGSRHVWDIEEIVRFCRINWKRPKRLK